MLGCKPEILEMFCSHAAATLSQEKTPALFIDEKFLGVFVAYFVPSNHTAIRFFKWTPPPTPTESTVRTGIKVSLCEHGVVNYELFLYY